MTVPWMTVPQQQDALFMLAVPEHLPLPLAMASHVGYELSCLAIGWQRTTGCQAVVGRMAGREDG